MSANSVEMLKNSGRIIYSRRRFLGVVAVSGMVAATEVAFPHIPYETDPYNIRDSTIWRALRGPFGGVMELCGAGDKDSNYWQWPEVPIPKLKHSALLRGNFDTFVREKTIDNIRMSCDGIHEVYKLEPPTDSTWRLIFQTVKVIAPEKYEPYEPTGHLFTGKLKGPIKFMRGNGDVLIYAMDENGNRIPLNVSGPFPREDSKVEGRLI